MLYLVFVVAAVSLAFVGQPGGDGKTESIRAGKHDEPDHRVTITNREENSSPHPDHDGSFAGLLPAYVENLRLVRVEVTGIPVALCGVGPVFRRRGRKGAGTDFALLGKNLSNQHIQGNATVQLKGKLMGTGDTQVWAQFRPKTESGDMDLTVQVEDTAMVSLSDLARAYGKFDVAAGAFSMYADLRVRDGTIDGYVKPVVRGLEMSRDAPASFREKLYEGLVDVSAKVLKNRPRREIVTVMDVSGRVDQPQIRTWQVVRGLLRNAFIKAVYPGFERDEGRTAKLKPPPAIR